MKKGRCSIRLPANAYSRCNTLEPERLVRRIEVITGGDGRRRWTVDEKARIVSETPDPSAVVSVIARRYGLTPQQLFAWRREARKRTAPAADLLPGFVPGGCGPV
jgi:transposase